MVNYLQNHFYNYQKEIYNNFITTSFHVLFTNKLWMFFSECKMTTITKSGTMDFEDGVINIYSKVLNY